MTLSTNHSGPPILSASAPVCSQWRPSTDGNASGPPGGRGPRRVPPALHAYTLLELLTVITIMGLIAGLAAPTLRALKPNAKVAATRELLDAVSRARQLAISQRTTVFMVFVPVSFWTDPATASWTATDWKAATNLFDKQLIGYNYACLRSVGDQPGAHAPRYLSSWKTLPQGAYIPPDKFLGVFTIPDLATAVLPFSINNNNLTTGIPFPLETTQPYSASQPYVPLPYIAFDGTGQLVSGPRGLPELIPLTEGVVAYARNADTKAPLAEAPTVTELPAGNTTNNFSFIFIERLTGRAHVERRKVQ
jgi:prepilin-type N-terminal cleavage/methylation domain-containing protein